MSISPAYSPFDSKGVFCPMPDADILNLSPVEDRLYTELAEAGTQCAKVEAEAATATQALTESVRNLRDAEQVALMLPKLTQKDLILAVLAANRR